MRDFAEILTGGEDADCVFQLAGYAEDIVRVVAAALQGLDQNEAADMASIASSVLEVAAACLDRVGNGAFALERDRGRGIFKGKGVQANG